MEMRTHDLSLASLPYADNCIFYIGKYKQYPLRENHGRSSWNGGRSRPAVCMGDGVACILHNVESVLWLG